MTTSVGEKKRIAEDKLFQGICYRARTHTSYRFHILAHSNKLNFESGYFCLLVAAGLGYTMRLG